MRPLELWGGLECTVNRVGDRFHDQLERSGHTRRVADIERFAALGLTALRYPVLWEAVAPDRPGAHDWRAIDERLGRIRTLGINPIVGLLHHGSGPAYTSLDAADFPERFAEYARAAAERYPWVRDWTPINEPLTTARFSGLYGHWYPHGRDDRTFVRILVNEIRATILAMQEIRAVIPGARLIQTEDLGRPSGTPPLRRQVRYESDRRWLTWDLLAGRVDDEHPLFRRLVHDGVSVEDLNFLQQARCPPDVIGINYYLTSDRWLDHRVQLYPPWSHGGNGEIAYADVEAVRARPKGVIGHEAHLMAAWRRYGRPVALTEVHLGGTRDEQMRWLVEAWRAAERARAQGAEVQAVTLWSLLGSCDWDSLVTMIRGHYEPGPFDVRGPEPRLTAVAAAARELAAGRMPEHPVLQTEGWWRRPSRLTWGAAASAGPELPPAGPPILVVGSRGTLGRALARICGDRGLRVHAASRRELDLCDPAGVDAALRTLEPWAVVNAAGFVRVDAAESDREGCWRDNVTAAVNLAAACRRRGLPLVTFSSDLVFDGAAARPYVETDTPAPLNAYGESKAEAERRVLDLLPNALVVRTSAFFGPWDVYNFATLARQALREGRSFPAAHDAIVSPTYVPDLVHAVLDLLIDGERGVWHLANQGAVTWCDFGRLVAETCGLDGALIEVKGWRDIWQPAVRPAFSALDSSRGRLLRPLDAAVRAYLSELATAEAREAERLASS
jgi:dTDP-4-dehydrorhamnose reductase